MCIRAGRAPGEEEQEVTIHTVARQKATHFLLTFGCTTRNERLAGFRVLTEIGVAIRQEDAGSHTPKSSMFNDEVVIYTLAQKIRGGADGVIRVPQAQFSAKFTLAFHLPSLALALCILFSQDVNE